MMVKLKTNVVVLLFVEQAGLLQFVAFFCMFVELGLQVFKFVTHVCDFGGLVVLLCVC